MKRAVLVSIMLLAACDGADNAALPGDAADTQPFAEIGEHETLRFAGTEPFWGGHVAGESLTWTTPEDIDGETIAVKRFAGRGGLSFSGQLAGAPFILAVTPGECSDGMSDRQYPLVATVRIGEERREGCAWREGDVLEDGGA